MNNEKLIKRYAETQKLLKKKAEAIKNATEISQSLSLRYHVSIIGNHGSKPIVHDGIGTFAQVLDIINDSLTASNAAVVTYHDDNNHRSGYVTPCGTDCGYYPYTWDISDMMILDKAALYERVGIP